MIIIEVSTDPMLGVIVGIVGLIASLIVSHIVLGSRKSYREVQSFAWGGVLMTILVTACLTVLFSILALIG